MKHFSCEAGLSFLVAFCACPGNVVQAYVRVKMHGTPLPTAPALRILSLYRIPLAQGVGQTSHVADNTTCIRVCLLSEGGAFFAFAFFALLMAIGSSTRAFIPIV